MADRGVRSDNAYVVLQGSYKRHILLIDFGGLVGHAWAMSLIVFHAYVVNCKPIMPNNFRNLPKQLF